MHWDNRRWFNLGAPFLTPGLHMVRPWTLFRRCSTEGHWWGFGLLQVNTRHLFFFGRTQGYPEKYEWLLWLGFLRLI